METTLEELYKVRKKLLGLIWLKESELPYADGPAYYEDKRRISQLRDDLVIVEIAIDHKEPKQIELNF